MKYSIFILTALLCNCSPYLPSSSNSTLNGTVQIVVECRSDKQTESAALFALRTFRLNDLEKRNDGVVLLLKARYQELSDYQAVQIKDRLHLVTGVLDVQIVRDGVPVKNAFFQDRNAFNGN